MHTVATVTATHTAVCPLRVQELQTQLHLLQESLAQAGIVPLCNAIADSVRKQELQQQAAATTTKQHAPPSSLCRTRCCKRCCSRQQRRTGPQQPAPTAVPTRSQGSSWPRLNLSPGDVLRVAVREVLQRASRRLCCRTRGKAGTGGQHRQQAGALQASPVVLQYQSEHHYAWRLYRGFWTLGHAAARRAALRPLDAAPPVAITDGVAAGGTSRVYALRRLSSSLLGGAGAKAATQGAITAAKRKHALPQPGHDAQSRARVRIHNSASKPTSTMVWTLALPLLLLLLSLVVLAGGPWLCQPCDVAEAATWRASLCSLMCARLQG